MPKILIITGSFPYVDSPASGSFIKDQVEVLQRHFQIDICVIRPIKSLNGRSRKYDNSSLNNTTAINECKYVSFPKNFAPKVIGFFLYKSISNKFNLENYDVIYVHSILPAGMIIPFINKSGIKTPTVLMVHGSDWNIKWEKNYLKKPIYYILDTASYIWLSGPNLKKSISENIPSIKKKLKVVYNLVPPEIRKFKKIEKKLAREKLGWDNYSTELISLAYLAPVKGVDILIEALSKIDSNLWDRIHIFGDSPDNIFKGKIIKLISKLNLTSKVILAGTVNREELGVYYSASDLYVLPSRNEGFNVSLLEALNFSLPLIATDCGGANLLIKDRAYLPKINSVTELKYSLEHAIQNLDIMQKEKVYNYEFVDQNCSEQSLIDRFNNII